VDVKDEASSLVMFSVVTPLSGPLDGGIKSEVLKIKNNADIDSRYRNEVSKIESIFKAEI